MACKRRKKTTCWGESILCFSNISSYSCPHLVFYISFVLSTVEPWKIPTSKTPPERRSRKGFSHLPSGPRQNSALRFHLRPTSGGLAGNPGGSHQPPVITIDAIDSWYMFAIPRKMGGANGQGENASRLIQILSTFFGTFW